MTLIETLAEVTTGRTLLAFSGLLTLAFGLGAWHSRASTKKPKLQARKIVVQPPAEPKLPIEVDDPDLDEMRVVSRYVAGLMMADEWTAIADKMAEWEAELATTPAGARLHDIALKVSLSGLQNVIDEAPRDTLDDLEPARFELAHFMDTYTGAKDSHVLALLAARAQIMLGEACRAEHWPDDQRKEAWRKMAHHFVLAGEILAEFDALSYMSPMLAEAHYLQALGSPAGDHRLGTLFQTWIDLDPASAAIYATHANHLADTDKISDEDILREAELATERTEDSLGFGGYAFFFLPLLETRPGARHLLEAELFATALLDLASLSSATQAEANWAAGILAGELTETDVDNELVYRDTLTMLIESHLKVIYPRLWPIPQPAIERLIAKAEIMPGLLEEAGLGQTKLAHAA